MSTSDLASYIKIARELVRVGQPWEPIIESMGVDPAIRLEIEAAVTPIPGSLIGTAENDWTSRLQDEDWYYSARLREYLVGPKGWNLSSVESIDEWSHKILRKMPDPRTGRFRSQGLVIGYVQAGKTANYTALAARAVDAGYKLVLVLAGIHNSLRKQTQDRLDQELTGQLLPGVGKAEHGRQWIRVTGDFDFDDKNIGPECLQGVQPKLAVVKKICPVLEKLVEWFESADTDTLANTPILVIDDEADQASVNTGDDRPMVESDADDYIEKEDENLSPSRTNELIRKLLGQLPKVSYVGYTATPFANILIDPRSVDREVGKDLFPENFIIQLPKPEDYTGTKELFGNHERASRDAVHIVPPHEADCLRTTQRRQSTFSPSITESLERAIHEFILAGAVRLYRGQDEPNTMLIHTTHLTGPHGKLVTVIKGFVEGIQGRMDWGTQGNGVLADLERTWNLSYRHSVDDGVSFNELKAFIKKVLSRIRVKGINSLTGDELDYEKGALEQVIAVGGNRLSRGLTLEGLTVSFFLRTSSMADTLLQMCRWYGHRKGFEDLIRIYTNGDLVEWFGELALVEEDLRNEIYEMNAQGDSPANIEIKLRCHSSLILTSRLKMKNGEKIKAGYSGSHPQTIVFPLEDIAALNGNVEVVREEFGTIPFLNTEIGLLAKGVEPSSIIRFLESYSFAPEMKTVSRAHLVSWIRKQIKIGNLNDWTVFIPDNKAKGASQFNINGHSVGMTRRSRIAGSNSIGILVDPVHEGVDIQSGPAGFKREKNTYDAAAMRRARPTESGLLIVYPIDPESKSKGGERTELFAEGQERPESLIGFCLSLPHVSDDETVEYVVGRQWK